MKPADYLATAEASEAIEPVRAFFGISEEDHARIVGDIAQDENTGCRERAKYA